MVHGMSPHPLSGRLREAEARKASKIVLKIYQYTGQERILVDVCTLKPPVSTKALRENFGATLEEENGGSIFFERVTEPGIYCIEDAKRKRGAEGSREKGAGASLYSAIWLELLNLPPLQAFVKRLAEGTPNPNEIASKPSGYEALNSRKKH